VTAVDDTASAATAADTSVEEELTKEVCSYIYTICTYS
jgi:hypothetical protein